MYNAKSNDVKYFLEDFAKNAETTILEEGKEKSELEQIAEARGIQIKGSRALAIFKTVYAFTDQANSNGAVLPKQEMLKVLPQLVGKPVSCDHIRNFVIGHYIDYRYKAKEDKIIAYGIFYKGNFTDLWKQAQELFKIKKLSTSFEIWAPMEKRKQRQDGSFELHDMEIAGGALLFNEEPSFKDAIVLEMAKNQITEQQELVYASKYKDEDMILSKEIIMELENTVEIKEEKPVEEKIIPVDDTVQIEPVIATIEETPPVEPVVTENTVIEPAVAAVATLEEPKIEEVVQPTSKKIVCSNCNKEFESDLSSVELKCPNCFALLDSEGVMKFPPQIVDFKVSCECGSSAWKILEKSEEKMKIKCQTCAKEYSAEFVEKQPVDELLDRVQFIYERNISCRQCGSSNIVSTTSKEKEHLIKCHKCGLDFIVDLSGKDEIKKIKKIEKVIEEPVKSSKEIEVNEIEGLQKRITELETSSISKEEENIKLKEEITNLSSLVSSYEEKMTTIVKDAENTVNLYLENAKKIVERRAELGEEFAKDLSDKDILEDDKFNTAKTNKLTLLTEASKISSSDVIGDKTANREDSYASYRKEINDRAFGNQK